MSLKNVTRMWPKLYCDGMRLVSWWTRVPAADLPCDNKGWRPTTLWYCVILRILRLSLLIYHTFVRATEYNSANCLRTYPTSSQHFCAAAGRRSWKHVNVSPGRPYLQGRAMKLEKWGRCPDVPSHRRGAWGLLHGILIVLSELNQIQKKWEAQRQDMYPWSTDTPQKHAKLDGCCGWRMYCVCWHSLITVMTADRVIIDRGG